MEERKPGPLGGVLVIDLSQMLPGAVVVRQLVDLGARVIKLEPPSGDPMRLVPPEVGGQGVGFAAFFRGVESVAVDLNTTSGQETARALARHADVCLLSNRPRTLARWGLGPERLAADNERLVVLTLWSLPGPAADRPAHDLNLAASTGLLDALGGMVPRVQVVDAMAGMAAVASILAALYGRERTGRGAVIHQPLVTGALPLLTWLWAEVSLLGREGGVSQLLGGASPCYRLYRTGEGGTLAVAAVEPKFWDRLVERLGLEDLKGAGWASGEEGERIARRLGEKIQDLTLDQALALLGDLPVSPVSSPAQALGSDAVADLVEALPGTSGRVRTAGPHLALGRSPDKRAPALGEHTEAVLREFGLWEAPDPHGEGGPSVPSG